MVDSIYEIRENVGTLQLRQTLKKRSPSYATCEEYKVQDTCAQDSRLSCRNSKLGNVSRKRE